VWALHAPKLLSDLIFFDITPRIWCVAQQKGPFPCCGAPNVDCKSRTPP
jgi:hypothetical protein